MVKGLTMRSTRWMFLLMAVAALALFAAACSDDDDDASDADSATEAAEDTDADDSASSDASSDGDDADADASGDATADDGVDPALAAVLDGLSCTGDWQNTTFGSTGAFAVSSELGGGGGQFTLELGGNVFGAVGGTVTLPYTIEGNEIVIAGDGGFLGALDLRIDPSGTVGGTIAAPPALGANASVTVTEFSLTGQALRLAVDIDFGDGSAPAMSVVDATCAA